MEVAKGGGEGLGARGWALRRAVTDATPKLRHLLARVAGLRAAHPSSMGRRSLLPLLLAALLPRSASAYQEVHELDVRTYQKVADGIWLIKFCEHAFCTPPLSLPTKASHSVHLAAASPPRKTHRRSMVRPLQKNGARVREGS